MPSSADNQQADDLVNQPDSSSQQPEPAAPLDLSPAPMSYTPPAHNPMEGAHYTTPEPRRRVRRRKRKGGLLRRITKRIGFKGRVTTILVGIVTVLIIGVVLYAVLVVDSLARVNSSIVNLERSLSTLQGASGANISMSDFQRLQAGVREVDESLNASQQRLALIRPFQTIHPTIDTTLRSLDIARRLTLASRAMLNGVQPAANYLFSGDEDDATGAQLSSGDRLVELLEIGNLPFRRAETNLNQARDLIAELNLEGAPLDLLRTTERIISFYEQIASINGVFLNADAVLNTILGLDGDRTYLVLAVNSDELRPSGGYLSTWGWFKVRAGRIVEYDYSASTTTSPMPPSEEDAFAFSVPNWWIQYREPLYAAWDGSWYADFPSTAQMAMWYYNNGENVNSPVDGVLSIDIYAFEYLLEALGSVSVQSGTREVTVTAGNFREVVYDIRAFSTGPEPHKQFVADLYTEIMAEWQSASRDPERNTLIINALLRAAQEKHLMVYLAEPEFNQVIDLLGWSGRQQQDADASDYLMIVSSNMTNKSSRSVTRGYIYDVTLNDDFSIDRRLTFNYEFPASVAENDPAVNPEFHGLLDYTAMAQIYGPLDSTLTEFSRDINFPSEFVSNNLWMISTAFVTPFDQSRRVQFEYSTPEGYSRFGNFGRYRLQIEKQPGINADGITVQVTLPPNTVVVESIPPIANQFDVGRPVVEYALNMLVDQEIDLIFEYRPVSAAAAAESALLEDES